MDPQEWKRINDIVDTALELEGNRRRTYISKECGDNDQLRYKVTELLESIEQSDTEDFLEPSEAFPAHLAADLSAGDDQQYDSSLVGQTIGRYHIKKLIGHGGMGSVFLAERADEAYEQDIALKVMRRGMDTPSNIARFERERNILAKLDHPNIARLLDGGLTDAGLPYLVMEYVDGLPLFEYCDKKKLSVEERLNLFKEVCQAVRHAHQNAVIHRDLKPSNILITDDGDVKVLDFGIAKLLEGGDSDTNQFQTRTGTRLLSYGYAAPEQVEGNAVTTATDAYALGILLYELLCGVHPFDLGDKELTEVEHTIREQSPDTLLRQFQGLSQDQQKRLARNRYTTESSLSQTLKGDLDAIVMKALRKEPEERYSSAGQLLIDLERREQNLPIVAREDTWRYKSKKFIRRHRAGLLSAATVLLVISGIIGYYTTQLTEQKFIAQREANKAEEAVTFLTDLIEANYPENAQGDTITVRQFLNRGYEKVKNLDHSPAVKANTMQVMANTYRSLGEIDKASSLIRRVIKIQDTVAVEKFEKAKSHNLYGLILRDEGEMKGAEKAMETSLKLYRNNEGTNTNEYAKLLRDLAYVKNVNGNYDQGLVVAKRAIKKEKKSLAIILPKPITFWHLFSVTSKNTTLQKRIT